MKQCVLWVLLMALLGCHRPEPQEVQWLGHKCIHIQYKQPVEGYTVKVSWLPEVGCAWLKFTRDKQAFYIVARNFEDPYFKPFNPCYKNPRTKTYTGNDIYYLDYQAPYDTEELGYNSPFFFKDVDFDGKKELLVTNWRQGKAPTYNRVRGVPLSEEEDRYFRHNTYDVYKLHYYTYSPVTVGRVEQLTYPPFNPLEGQACFNYQNKTITVSIPWCGGYTYYCPSSYKLVYAFHHAKSYKLVGGQWDVFGRRGYPLQLDTITLKSHCPPDYKRCIWVMQKEKMVLLKEWEENK